MSHFPLCAFIFKNQINMNTYYVCCDSHFIHVGGKGERRGQFLCLWQYSRVKCCWPVSIFITLCILRSSEAEFYFLTFIVIWRRKKSPIMTSKTFLNIIVEGLLIFLMWLFWFLVCNYLMLGLSGVHPCPFLYLHTHSLLVSPSIIT